jgi:hypothetical protein
MTLPVRAEYPRDTPHTQTEHLIYSQDIAGSSAPQ